MLNGIYWIMDNNSKGSLIKTKCPILFYKNFTEVPDASYYLEYRKTFVCKKRLQQIENQGWLSIRSAVSVWYQCRRIYMWHFSRKKVQLSCAITQNNLWGLAKNSMERILYRDGIAVHCWITKLWYITIQSEKLPSNIIQHQLNDFMGQESSVRI